MKNILLLLTGFWALSNFGQDIQWENTFGGKHADYLYDAVPTLDYGFIMVGGTLSNKTGDIKNNAGDTDCFITKITENGSLEWTKTFGGSETDKIKCIVNAGDGGYLLAAMSNSPIGDVKTTAHIGQQDIWLVKLNIKGDISWQKSLGGLGNEQVNALVKTRDGGYLIAMSTASGMHQEQANTENTVADVIYKTTVSRGNLDYWLVKIDANGKELWQKSFGGKYRDDLQQVLELEDGSIVLGGTSNSPAGFDKHTEHYGISDWWIIKLDAQGQEIWQLALGDEGNDTLASLLESTDHNIIIGGNFRDTSGEADFKLYKLDLEGETLWEQSYDMGKNDILIDCIQNEDGSLVLSGYTASKRGKYGKQVKKAQRGTEDFLVLKTNADGEELWQENYGGKHKEVLAKTVMTRDGGYVLMGTRMPLIPQKHNDANFWIVKLLDNAKDPYKKLALEAVPNPTDNYTQIVLGDDYKKGTVQIVDIAGKVVQQFALDGKRIIPVALTGLATGVYIIHVQTDVLNNSVKVIKR
jgi:hypothetical protein